MEEQDLSLQNIIISKYKEEFMEAISFGNTERMKDFFKLPQLLLEIFIKNQENNPLLIASNNGNLSVIKTLLEGLKAHPKILNDLLTSTIDENGKNLLYLAIERGDVEFIKHLLSSLEHSPEALNSLMMGTINNVNVEDSVKNESYNDSNDINSSVSSSNNSEPYIEKQTCLHLAVKKSIEDYNDFEIFSRLLASIEMHSIVLKNLVMQCDDDGNTILHLAVYGKSLEVIERLLVSLKDVPIILKDLMKFPDKDNRNMLFIAIRRGYSQVIDGLLYFLQHFPEIIKDLLVTSDDFEPTPLHVVVNVGCLESIKQVIVCTKRHPEILNSVITANKYGKTIFHLAIEKGNNEIVRQLLVDYKDYSEIHSFFINTKRKIQFLKAAEEGNLKIVTRLLSTKNLNVLQSIVTATTTDCQQKTALHLAARIGNSEIIKKILCTVEKNFSVQLLESLIVAIDYPNANDSTIQNTLLYYSVLEGHINVVHQLLLSLKSYPEIFKALIVATNDFWRKQTIYLAIKKDCNEILQKILHIMESHHDIYQSLLSVQKNVQLRKAVRTGDIHAVQQVLESASADGKILEEVISSFDHFHSERDNDILYHAVSAGYTEIISELVRYVRRYPELLKKLISYRFKRDENKTILHLSCETGNFLIVELLISSINEYPDFINSWMLSVCSSYNKTALHYSSELGDIQVIDRLLINEFIFYKSLRSLILSTDSNNQTALHHAIKNGHNPVVNQLLLFIEEILELNYPGTLEEILFTFDNLSVRRYSVLHLAAKLGNLTVVKRLLDTCLTDEKIKDLVYSSYGEESYTALHVAAKHGNVNVFCFLLTFAKDKMEKKYPGTLKELVLLCAKSRHCSQDSYSMLSLSSYKGHLEIVENLLNFTKEHIELFYPGTLTNLILCRDEYGSTALHYAVKYGHINIVSYLLSFITSNLEGKSTRTLEQLFLSTDFNNMNILKLALKNKCIDIVWLLLNTSKNYKNIFKELILSKNQWGNAIIPLAVNNFNLNFIESIFSFLKKDFPLLFKELILSKSNVKCTLLHYAVGRSDDKFTQILLNSIHDDIDVLKKLLLATGGYSNDTALHLAVREKRADNVTPLLNIVKKHPEILNKMLVKTNNSGWTVLHAAQFSDTKYIPQLIEASRNSNKILHQIIFKSSKNKQTFLHYMAENTSFSESERTLAYLKKYPDFTRALILKYDDKNKTALHYAEENEYWNHYAKKTFFSFYLEHLPPEKDRTHAINADNIITEIKAFNTEVSLKRSNSISFTDTVCVGNLMQKILSMDNDDFTPNVKNTTSLENQLSSLEFTPTELGYL